MAYDTRITDIAEIAAAAAAKNAGTAPQLLMADFTFALADACGDGRLLLPDSAPIQEIEQNAYQRGLAAGAEQLRRRMAAAGEVPIGRAALDEARRALGVAAAIVGDRGMYDGGSFTAALDGLNAAVDGKDGPVADAFTKGLGDNAALFGDYEVPGGLGTLRPDGAGGYFATKPSGAQAHFSGGNRINRGPGRHGIDLVMPEIRYRARQGPVDQTEPYMARQEAERIRRADVIERPADRLGIDDPEGRN